MAEKKTNKNSQIIATGRRKKSIARVRLFPGTGKCTVNGREMGEYLQRDTLLLVARQPFEITETGDMTLLFALLVVEFQDKLALSVTDLQELW